MSPGYAGMEEAPPLLSHLLLQSKKDYSNHHLKSFGSAALVLRLYILVSVSGNCNATKTFSGVVAGPTFNIFTPKMMQDKYS